MKEITAVVSTIWPKIKISSIGRGPLSPTNPAEEEEISNVLVFSVEGRKDCGWRVIDTLIPKHILAIWRNRVSISFPSLTETSIAVIL